MNYPRIYSLSTVGILKHYIHDYLFHSVRTDFIGPNGVGKSIIADLLQMIFVYDKNLIKFGTDGVKREERKIHTLPYKSKFAYCFLNIEVDAGKFITIGIQINSQKGKRIIPFVISKQADINQNINKLSLNKEELLFANNLLKVKNDGEKEIVNLQDLATLIYEKERLRLNFFSNNESVNTYYRFLYDKNIMPLNLSQDKNLKAYAKVIQSFSKAKAINLSGNQASRSLKEFLFDESDEDILTNFKKEQSELETILREYESLNQNIKKMAFKQAELTQLQNLEQSYKEKLKLLKSTELQNLHYDVRQIEQKKVKAEESIENKQAEIKDLIATIKRFPEEEKVLNEKYEEADENYNNFNRYEELSKNTEKLKENIRELETLILPIIDGIWKNEVQKIDISIRDNQDIKREIVFAEPYLKKYRTLGNLTKVRQEQSEELDKRKISLKQEKETKEKQLSLLRDNDDNGLLHWYIKNRPTLNEEQLQTILFYATKPVSEISNPNNSSQYINTDELVHNFKSHSYGEGKGLWLKLGALHQFIEFNPDATLLGETSDFKQSIQQLTIKLKEEIRILTIKLEALKNIQDAKPYDHFLFDYSFDIAIVENSSIERLKDAVACILQINEKVSQLQIQKKNEEKELKDIKDRFKVEFEKPEIVKEELLKIRKQWSEKRDLFNVQKGAKQSRLESLEELVLIEKEDLGTITNNLTKKKKEFKTFNDEYLEDFGETITEFTGKWESTENLVTNHEDSWNEYKRVYIGISNAFEETSDEKNPAVQLTIKKTDFSFQVLEEALLGSKIKTTDNITTALEEANQSRTTIANGIRDNMIKIFSGTTERYDKYKEQITRINTFFVNRKISNKFYFNLEFDGNKEIKIDYIRRIAHEVRNTATKGELKFGDSITDFIEEFFKGLAKIKDKVPIDKLLNPQTYFDLSAKLTDKSGTEVPGSSGETYSALALLGVARLSAAQKKQREALRFIILEELGSLDNTNFSTFPDIAKEFQYQIITMAPHTFNIGLSEEWYAHHLIKGKGDENVNYYPSASYFKTKDAKEELSIYIDRISQ